MLPAVCTCSPRAPRRSLAGGECRRGMNDATSNCNFYCGYCVSSRSRLGSATDECKGLLPDLCWHLYRSEEHTSELQSQSNLVCRLLLEKKKIKKHTNQ